MPWILEGTLPHGGTASRIDGKPMSLYYFVLTIPLIFFNERLLIFVLLPLPRLVIETLEPLPQDRKCFRMVNGVLVERTVKEVLPALKTNAEGLKQVLDDLLKQYKAKQTEMENWKVSPHHGLFLFTTEEGCMAVLDTC